MSRFTRRTRLVPLLAALGTLVAMAGMSAVTTAASASGTITLTGKVYSGGGTVLSNDVIAAFNHGLTPSSTAEHKVLARTVTGPLGGFYLHVSQGSVVSTNGKSNLDVVLMGPSGRLWIRTVTFSSSASTVRVGHLGLRLLPTWTPSGCGGCDIEPAAGSTSTATKVYYPTIMFAENSVNEKTRAEISGSTDIKATVNWGVGFNNMVLSGSVTIGGYHGWSQTGPGFGGGSSIRALEYYHPLKVRRGPSCWNYGDWGRLRIYYGKRVCTDTETTWWSNSGIGQRSVLYHGCYSLPASDRFTFAGSYTLPYFSKTSGRSVSSRVGAGFLGKGITVSTSWSSVEREYLDFKQGSSGCIGGSGGWHAAPRVFVQTKSSGGGGGCAANPCIATRPQWLLSAR